jgi:hypothetical protein
MSSTQAVPLVLCLLVALLLVLLIWGFWRTRRHQWGDALMSARDDVLLGLLIFAVVSLAVFVTYVLLGLSL